MNRTKSPSHHVEYHYYQPNREEFKFAGLWELDEPDVWSEPEYYGYYADHLPSNSKQKIILHTLGRSSTTFLLKFYDFQS